MDSFEAQYGSDCEECGMHIDRCRCQHQHRWVRNGQIVRLGRARSQGHIIPQKCECGETRQTWVGY